MPGGCWDHQKVNSDCSVTSAFPYSDGESDLTDGLYCFSHEARYRSVGTDQSWLILPGETPETLLVHNVGRTSIINEYPPHAVAPYWRSNDHGAGVINSAVWWKSDRVMQPSFHSVTLTLLSVAFHILILEFCVFVS